MIVRGYRELRQHYQSLQAGDVFIGRIVARPLKYAYLIDLAARGVHCLPAPLAQCLHGSKIAQALILADWMIPMTRVIRRRSQLLEAINAYNRHAVGAVITKKDHMHCGHGVRRWNTIEMLYNIVAYTPSEYPFVLQPFLSRFTDVRAVVVDDYVEAYTRYNRDNFRMNLAAGGLSRPWPLTGEQETFCRKVMQRGRFPFAHLDLNLLEDGKIYLAEVTLEGGIKGARIDRPTLNRLKDEVLEKQASELAASPAASEPQGLPTV
jgi:ribosomal protein S6--L-glutamate ligase